MTAAGREERFGDPRLRGLFYQALLVVAVGALVVGGAAQRLCQHAGARHSAWASASGTRPPASTSTRRSSPIPRSRPTAAHSGSGFSTRCWSAPSAIALATPLGFAIGVARLSPNWLLSRLALVYVELMRNTPLLLQLLFWYNAVLKALPGPRQSLSLGGVVFLNNRGLYLPRPIFADGAGLVVARAWRWRPLLAAALGVLGAAAPGGDRRAGAGRAGRARR